MLFAFTYGGEPYLDPATSGYVCEAPQSVGGGGSGSTTPPRTGSENYPVCPNLIVMDQRHSLRARHNRGVTKPLREIKWDKDTFRSISMNDFQSCSPKPRISILKTG